MVLNDWKKTLKLIIKKRLAATIYFSKKTSCKQIVLTATFGLKYKQ
jgi:hypothetical protein